MPESISTPDRITRSRHMKKAAIILAGSLSLGACTEGPEPSANYTPVERLALDYVWTGADYKPQYKETCLAYSAYDVDSGNRGRGSVTPPSTIYDSKSDILTVTPVSPGKTLKMTGFNQYDHRVQPFDQDSKDIFSSFGCDPTTPYPPK